MEDIGASDFCSYNEAFLKVYSMFVEGIDLSLLTPETDRNLFWLSVFYAFLFTIVILNIIVAVVFDAWGRVSLYGRLYYWRYRHQYLVEARRGHHIRENSTRAVFTELEKLDSHLESVIERFNSRPESVSHASSRSERIQGVTLYFAEGLYLGAWFVLGLLSASLLWPKAFRATIFSLADEALKSANDSKDSSNDESAVVSEESVTKLVEAIADLEETKRQLFVSQSQHQELVDGLSELKQLVLGLQTPIQRG
jgi:ABC-type multidrug transport system fused ATPase/permease subunit